MEDSAKSNGDKIVTEPGARPPHIHQLDDLAGSLPGGFPPIGGGLPADIGTGSGSAYAQVGVERVLYPLQDNTGVAAVDSERHPHGVERFQVILRVPIEAMGQRLVVQIVKPAPAAGFQSTGQDTVQRLDAAHLEQVLPFVDDQRIEAFQSGPAAVDAHSVNQGDDQSGHRNPRREEVPEPGGPAYQCDLCAGFAPASGQPFCEERLAGSRAARAEHPRIRLCHIRHAHLVVGISLDAPPGVLHLMKQPGIYFVRRGGIHIRAQILLESPQCVVIGLAFLSISRSPVLEQTAQPTFEIAAAAHVGEHRGIPLGAGASPFAIREHHPVTDGESIENIAGEIGAQISHQSTQRRLRLAERAFLRSSRPAVAIPVLPDTARDRRPSRP